MASYSQTEGSSHWSILSKEQEVLAPTSGTLALVQCWEKQPHAPPAPPTHTPVLETKRVYDLELWRTVGNRDSTLRDHGHRMAGSLSQLRISRLQRVWCSGQHLETMPSIGWGSQPAELQTGDSLQTATPSPTHTQKSQTWL